MTVPAPLARMQAELLQTLIAALGAGGGLGAGDARGQGAGRPPVVQATLMGLVAADTVTGQPATATTAGQPQRMAEALIGGRVVRLMLEPGSAPMDRLVAGARLALAFEPQAGEGLPRARIVETAPPPSNSATPASDEPVPAPSPRALAAPAAIAALARQDSAAPLIATLRLVASQPAMAANLPAPVQRAAAAVMGLMPSPDALADPDGAPLKQAITASGLFHEHAQAQAGDGNRAPLDLKGALLALRRELLSAGGPNDPAPQTHRAEAAPRPVPPVPEGPLQPRGDVTARLPDAASPVPLMAQMLGETEAALDRLTLLQFASLPEAGSESATTPGPSANPSASQPANPTRLMLELPFVLDGKAGVLPLTIEEEPPERGRAEGEASRSGWRIRLAFDLEPLGLVQALIGLQAGALRVAVFAEREATARLARRHAGDLEAALADGPFSAAVVDVALGAPPAARARTGHFLDRRT